MTRRHARQLITGLLFVGVLLVVGLAPAYGAAHTGRQAADAVTLNFWNEDWGVFDQPTASMGDLYTAKNPAVKVKFSFNPNQFTKLETAIAAGTPPDCAEITLYGGTFSRLVANGALLPVDKYYKQAGVSLNEFGPTVRQSVQYQGHIYAIPADFDAFGLYYNKAMFRKYGLDPNKPPRTFADLVADNAKIYKESNGNVVSIGFDANGSVLGDMKQGAYYAGGQWFDTKTQKITATNPNNVKMLDWLTQWAKRFDINKVSRFVSSQPGLWAAGNPFATGKEAMYIDGWWSSLPLNKYAPGVDYGVTYVPTPNGTAAERANYPLFGWAVAIPKGSPHPDACWQFLKFGYHDNSAVMAVKTYSFPSVLAQIPTFWEMVKKAYPNDRILPYQNIFSDTARAGGTIFPTMPVGAQYAAAIDRATDQAVHGKKTPMQALTEVQTQTQAAYDQFKAAHH